MKRSNYLRNAIAGLFILSVIGFEMFVQSSANSSARDKTQNPPTCSVTFPTFSCSTDSNGRPIYSFQFKVAHNLCPTTTLTITSSSGTVQPSTFSNVTSGATYSFALFNPTSNPTFTFDLVGCGGESCKTIKQLSLPTNCGQCQSLSLPNVESCRVINNNVCEYAFTIHVNNSTGVPGVVALSSGSLGMVIPQTYNVNPGDNIISGVLRTSCGLSSATLSESLTLGGDTAPQACNALINLNPLPACASTTQCAATFPDVSCVKDANGNPIYNITANVTNNLGCPANLQITSSSGVLQPSTFPNVTSPSSVSFSLFGATTNPNFNFNWTGCGKTCKTTTKLPNGLPTNCGDCLALAVANIGACSGVIGNLCQYPFTMNVTNNTNDPGTVVISTNAGTVTPSVFNVIPGVNTISGILSVPCGTNPVTLTGVLTIPGNPALPPQTCKTTIVTKVPPPCVCNVKATAANQTICKGGSTHVDVPANTPGSIMWYYANAPCPTTAAPLGWLPLSGGTTWNTLALDQTTCYEAVVTNMPNCPNVVVSNPVKVTVMDPGAGSIACTVQSGGPCPADVCPPSVVNLSYSNPTASPNCSLQWEKWNGSQWQPIPGATAATLPPQTLTSSTCPFSTARFRMRHSCKPCAPTYTETSFNVYKPTQAGLLTVTKPTICEGDDDVLHYTPSCGDVVKWQISTVSATTGFSDILGSGGATTWYSNKLYQNTWYRVVVKNGPFPANSLCGEKYSNAVKITVKKKPAPTITASGPTTFCAPGGVALSFSGAAGGTCQWYRNGLPVGPATTFPSKFVNASGNYYVVCKNGCGIRKSNIIKVKASKVVAAIEGACGVCPPGCVNLQALAAGGVAPYSFLWLNNGFTGPIQSVCPATNTTYTVKVTDAIGCTTTASHTVNICKKLVVATAGPNKTICKFTSTTIGGSPTASLGTGPYTYSWSPTVGLSNPNVANPVAAPLLTTTYTLTVTDATGCMNTSTVTVTVKTGKPCIIILGEETSLLSPFFHGLVGQLDLTNEIPWRAERYVPSVNWACSPLIWVEAPRARCSYDFQFVSNIPLSCSTE